MPSRKRVSQRMFNINFQKLAASIVICLLAGIVGSVFTAPAINEWYSTLVKPTFSPPNWVFGPVWTTLYILMGVALYFIWTSSATSAKKSAKLKPVYTIFGIQLALNALWSFLFFGLQSPAYGLIGIIALWLAIVATIIMAYRISKLSAYLLVPYILWVTVAMVLNYAIYVMN